MSVVWLPFRESEPGLGPLPPGLQVDRWDGSGLWPETISDVEFYVLPYMLGSRALEPVPLMRRLRVLQTLTAGFDDVLAVRPPGVMLCNAPGVHDDSTAELAVTLTLASLRGIPDFVRAAGRHRWAPASYPALADRTVVVVGFGGVGQAVARRLQGFDVQVLPVASRPRDSAHGQVYGIDGIAALLPSADVVILCLPLNESTRGLVDVDFLATMKDGALLVNVSRGAVVVTAALLAELTAGRLTAAVDVTDPEPPPADHALWDAPGLLISPHVGGNTSAFAPRAHRFLNGQLRRYAAGEHLLGVVAG